MDANRLNYPEPKHFFASLDEAEMLTRSFAAGHLHCVQTTPGRLGATVHDLRTPHIELRESAFSAGAILSVAAPFPRFGLGISLLGETQVLGMQLTNSNIVYADVRDGVLVRLKPGSRWCNVSIDRHFLQQLAQTHEYELPDDDGTCGMSVAAHDALGRTLSCAARSQFFLESGGAELEDELALSVLRICNTRRQRGSNRRNHHWRSVHRVIEFIHREFATPITVTGLCRLAGVSERTLQYAFKAATGCTVQQYLMAYRLRRARELLLCGEYRQVSEVARACGLHHLGRFSQYYKRLFAELPRDTIPDTTAGRP